jgi:hypothetical protein
MSQHKSDRTQDDHLRIQNISDADPCPSQTGIAPHFKQRIPFSARFAGTEINPFQTPPRAITIPRNVFTASVPVSDPPYLPAAI